MNKILRKATTKTVIRRKKIQPAKMRSNASRSELYIQNIEIMSPQNSDIRRSIPANMAVTVRFEGKAKARPSSPRRPGVNKPKAMPNNIESIDFQKPFTGWQCLRNMLHLQL